MPGTRIGAILQRLFVIVSLACCLVIVCSGNTVAEADGLDTRKIIDIFKKISQVPRCSKDEGRISAWLVNWARERNLAVKTDATGNVIISVPGYQGRENVPPVALQAHIDMVCTKTADSPHDFTKDPITMIRDGEWLRADRTTLGADD
jgi:dipeptidase D